MSIFGFLHRAEKTPPGKGGVVSTGKDELMFESLTKSHQHGKQEALFSADGADHRRARAWLDAQLRRMKKERFFVQDHPTTPALAEVFMALNTNNRRIRSRGVDRLARIMTDGRYIETPVPIIVCSDGLVIDGQHRLSAIIQAGVSAPLTFAFGWPHQIFKVLDTGIVRSNGDALHIAGEEWSVQLAAALRKLENVRSGAPRGNAGIDNDNIIDRLAENPEIRDSCKYGSRIYRAKKVSPTAIVVAHYLITRNPHNEEIADQFFEYVATGLNLKSTRHPAHVLRAFFDSGEFRGKHGGAATTIAAATIKAFNEFKAGRKTSLKKIEWQASEPFPEVE